MKIRTPFLQCLTTLGYATFELEANVISTE